MRNRVTIALWLAILTLGLSMAGVSLWLHQSLLESREAAGRATLQIESLEASVASLEGRIDRVTIGVQALDRQRGINDAKVSETLRQNPEWSAGDTPDAVVDGLCDILDCVR